MTESDRYSDHHRADIIRDYRRLPWIREVAERYVSVVDLPIYKQFIDMMQKASDGADPIPDRFSSCTFCWIACSLAAHSSQQ